MYTDQSTKALPPSFDHIRSQYSYLKTIFSERNAEYEILRGLFDGSTAAESKTGAQVTKLTSNRHELIYNVLNAAVRRYMDQMSSPPRIDGVPQGFEYGDVELADKRAKLLQYIWDCNSMTVKLMQASFYQSLLDKAIFNVRPAPHLPHKVKIELAVPEFYYPITRGDNWQEPVAVIYGFRAFNDDMQRAQLNKDPMRFRADEDLNTIIEYWDPRHFVRIERDKALVIEHNIGVVLWEEAHNIPIPHRHRGQGDGDQIVGLQEYLNMLLGSFADMIAYAAAPVAVVRGTKVGGTNLPFTPRAVWELERDAQVGFLQWEGAPPTSEAQLLRVFQGIEDLTGVNSPAFGREIPSGTSGSAIRSLTAGFNSRTGTKQQLLGDCLVRVNDKIQLVLEKMCPDHPFQISGENVRMGRSQGKPTRYEVKAKEFQGWYKTRVIFNPLDTASTYFQEMDKHAKGLQSRFTTMKNLGVINVWDEMERIRIEQQEAADHENDLAMAKQGQFMSPDKQAQLEASDQAQMGQLAEQLKGLMPNNPGIAQDGVQDRQAKRDIAQAAQVRPQAAALPGPDTGPAGPSAMAEPELMLEDVMAKLKSANLSGRAALSGAITSGKGAGTIHLENPQDAEQIRQILGPQAVGVKFQGIEPNQQFAPDWIELKGQKKNPVAEARRLSDAYLTVVVQGVTGTNNALVYDIGLLDAKGNLVPFGRTNPQRVVTAEAGELIRVKISGLSRKGEKWGLVAPTPVKATAQVKPSSVADLQRLWEKGT